MTDVYEWTGPTGVQFRQVATADGTYYHDTTPAEVVRVLEDARRAGSRVRIHYGDPDTGQDWGDTFNVIGYVGRSTGQIPIPLMVNNARSMGGPAILDRCIVRIRPARRGGPDLYRHPNYTPPSHEGWSDSEWTKHFG